MRAYREREKARLSHEADAVPAAADASTADAVPADVAASSVSAAADAEDGDMTDADAIYALCSDNSYPSFFSLRYRKAKVVRRLRGNLLTEAEECIGFVDMLDIQGVSTLRAAGEDGWRYVKSNSIKGCRRHSSHPPAPNSADLTGQSRIFLDSGQQVDRGVNGDGRTQARGHIVRPARWALLCVHRQDGLRAQCPTSLRPVPQKRACARIRQLTTFCFF